VWRVVMLNWVGESILFLLFVDYYVDMHTNFEKCK
jgi:hypothetical protein